MKRTPKYFYICTGLRPATWIGDNGALVVSPKYDWPKYIGTEYWPFTQREAREQYGTIMQFENKPPYKFIKVVR